MELTLTCAALRRATYERNRGGREVVRGWDGSHMRAAPPLLYIEEETWRRRNSNRVNSARVNSARMNSNPPLGKASPFDLISYF